MGMSRRSHLLKVLLAGGFLSAQPLAADTAHWPGSLSEFTGGKSACIAIYSETDDLYLVSNLPQCQQQLAPCSTFKVPNALIGLESGVLSGPADTKKWDGTERERKVLNEDHDLSSAMKYSVVWYFQDVAVQIGPQRMQDALDSYDYGNRDISGGQDNFWLSSSLKISALEQVGFMQALANNELPASVENQEIVKATMRQDYSLPEGFSGELYGKTGTCRGPANHAWFTGFLQRDEQRYVFAVNLLGEDERSWDARALIIEVLQALR
jgi:beta-lactamase class D